MNIAECDMLGCYIDIYCIYMKCGDHLFAVLRITITENADLVNTLLICFVNFVMHFHGICVTFYQLLCNEMELRKFVSYQVYSQFACHVT